MFKKMALFALLVASCSYNTSSLQGGQFDGGGVVTGDTGTPTPDTMVSMDTGGATLPTDAVIADAPTAPDTSPIASTDTSVQTTPDAGPTIPDVLPSNPDTTVATDVQITQTDTTLAAGCTLDQQEVVEWNANLGRADPNLNPAYISCSSDAQNVIRIICPEVPGCITQWKIAYGDAGYVAGCSGTRTPCDQLTTKEQCLSSRKTDMSTAVSVHDRGANCLWNGSIQLPLGAACTSSSQCESTRCENYKCVPAT